MCQSASIPSTSPSWRKSYFTYSNGLRRVTNLQPVIKYHSGAAKSIIQHILVLTREKGIHWQRPGPQHRPPGIKTGIVIDIVVPWRIGPFSHLSRRREKKGLLVGEQTQVGSGQDGLPHFGDGSSPPPYNYYGDRGCAGSEASFE